MSSHPDIQIPTEDEPLVIPARLPYETTHQPFWTVLLSPVQTLIEMLPSHKDSRTGRKTAKRVRIGLVIVGLGFIVIYGSETVTLAIGIVLVVASLFVPISEVRKRSITGRLTSIREGRTRTITRPGRVVYDGRRVVLEKEGSKLRRVLTDRDEHTLELQETEERLYVKIAPDDGGRSETIWIGAEDIDPASLDGSSAVESISEDALDRPAFVEQSGWLEFWHTLHAS